jgi:hypothetical protein
MNIEFALPRTPFSAFDIEEREPRKAIHIRDALDREQERQRAKLRPIVRSAVEEEILNFYGEQAEQAQQQSDHENPAPSKFTMLDGARYDWCASEGMWTLSPADLSYNRPRVLNPTEMGELQLAALDAGRQLHEPAKAVLDGRTYTWEPASEVWVLDLPHRGSPSAPTFLTSEAMGKAQLESLQSGYFGREAMPCGRFMPADNFEHLAEILGQMEDEQMSKEGPIEAGDVVFLISGGLPMTVTSLNTFLGEHTQANLLWHDETGTIVTAVVETRFLEHA